MSHLSEGPPGRFYQSRPWNEVELEGPCRKPLRRLHVLSRDRHGGEKRKLWLLLRHTSQDDGKRIEAEASVGQKAGLREPWRMLSVQCRVLLPLIAVLNKTGAEDACSLKSI